jgi:hypothetical protein
MKQPAVFSAHTIETKERSVPIGYARRSKMNARHILVIVLFLMALGAKTVSAHGIPPGTPVAEYGFDNGGGTPLNLYNVPSGCTFYLTDVFVGVSGTADVIELRESGTIRQKYSLPSRQLSANYSTAVVFPENTAVQFESITFGSSYWVSISGFLVSSTAINEPFPDPAGPDRAQLQQNFPNPFNPSTTIQYSVAADGPVSLLILDVRGQRVRNLVDEYHAAGNYELQWDGKDNQGASVASGTYFYQLTVGNEKQAKKMLTLK